MGKALAEFIKRFGRKPKDQLEWLQFRFKLAQESGKGKVIEFPRDKITDWTKPRPTTGKKGEVIDTSFASGVDKSGKRTTMSNADYSSLKEEWFNRIIANTDDDINTFLKRGIDAADERFKNLTPKQRKDFLDMVDYRLKHGNEKFMEDSQMFFKEEFAGGGIAGMLGEPTYQDDNHRVPFKVGGKGKLLEGLAKILDEFFPGTTKVGKTSKPMAEKTQLRQAIADFQERENVIIDGKKYRRSDKDRPPTEEELEDDYAELWDDEHSPWDFGSTRREMDAALAEARDYERYMYQQYKMGKLDPEAGSVSRARLNLLRKRAEEAEDTKDSRVFTRDEADELDVLEDHFAQVDKEESFQFAERVRKAKEEARVNKKSPWYTDSKTLTPEEELRREFPGISDDLIKNILADDNPQRIAEVKAAMKEAMKMQEKGMGVEEIINIFKKKPTKHASGGLAGMLGE